MVCMAENTDTTGEDLTYGLVVDHLGDLDKQFATEFDIDPASQCPGFTTNRWTRSAAGRVIDYTFSRQPEEPGRPNHILTIVGPSRQLRRAIGTTARLITLRLITRQELDAIGRTGREFTLIPTEYRATGNLGASEMNHIITQGGIDQRASWLRRMARALSRSTTDPDDPDLGGRIAGTTWM